MIIHTAAEGITLARNLENESARFYEELAKQLPQNAETFLTFAKENKKYITQIERAYYGVITDAIEGCYAFNLESDKYKLDTAVPDKAEPAAVIAQAVKMEEKIVQFYDEAAEQSRSLMADVPRNFTIIAKKRDSRIAKLKTLS